MTVSRFERQIYQVITMTAMKANVGQYSVILYLPVLGDEISMFNQDRFEEVKPCPDPANKNWMTPSFMNLHREQMRRAFAPCAVCGYISVPMLTDEFGQQWIPFENEARRFRLDGFDVERLEDWKARGLLEQVYYGGGQ